MCACEFMRGIHIDITCIIIWQTIFICSNTSSHRLLFLNHSLEDTAQTQKQLLSNMKVMLYSVHVGTVVSFSRAYRVSPMKVNSIR